MDKVRVLCPDCHEAVHTQKAISDLQDVDISFGAKYAGRIVDERTDETLKVLVIFRQYKGRGPVFLSAVDPNMVVNR
ncbi:hypothetical protein hrd7_25150 [Leptolinea sp. HRD-7]|nr:hypothetical protein hrd7_25150 [Leptolinea sp. HRD-7]